VAQRELDVVLAAPHVEDAGLDGDLLVLLTEPPASFLRASAPLDMYCSLWS
jgi:hypothetical protein